MKKTLLTLLLAFVLIASVSAQDDDSTIIKSVGVTSLGAVWNKVRFAYKPLRPTIELQYNTSGNLDSDHYFTSITEDSGQLNRTDGLTAWFPLFLTPLVFTYNLPNVTQNSVVLDTTTLANIMLGKITYWGHPDILARNPQIQYQLKDLTLPIHWIVRAESNGITSKLTSYLSKISPEWKAKYGAVTVWPDEIPLNTTYPLPSSFATSAEIYQQTGGLALISYPYYLSLDVVNRVSVLSIYSVEDGITLTPDINTTREVMERLEQHDPLAYGNVSTTDLWPLNSIFFLGVLRYPSAHCSELKETYKFLKWLFTFRTLRISLESEQYLMFSEEKRLAWLDDLKDNYCNGDQILSANIIEDPKGPGEIIFLIISLLILSAIWVAQYFLFGREIVLIAKVYQILLLVGSSISFLSLIFWFLEPTGTWICQLRIWLMCAGISILLGTVFSRSLQLKKIQQMIEAGRVKKVLNHEIIVAVAMTVVIGVQIAYLIIWTAVDAYGARLAESDVLLNTFVRQCTSDNINVWVGLQGSYFAILLLWGIFVVYTTWSIHSSVDDSRLLVMSIYTCMMAICISAALIAFALPTDKAHFWWASIFVIVVTVSLTGSVYLPKILEAASSSSDSKGGSKKVIKNMKTTNLEMR